MKSRFLLSCISVFATVVGPLLMQSAAHAADDRSITTVKAEIARLQQSMEKNPLNTEGLPDLGKDVTNFLTQAKTAADSGNLYAALENVGRATDLMSGVRAIQEKSEAISSGLPAFEMEWNEQSLQLASMDEKARHRDWSGAPVAIRALAEGAQGKATPLLEGGRGFAVATHPKDGLFYMGQANGEAEFSSFLYQLSVPRHGNALALRSYVPELQRLQQKVNAAFVPPKSIDMHPRFIALNATLKLAGELDSSRSYAGSLYSYLEATRHYGMLDAAIPDATRQKQLQATIAAKLKATATSARDDSIQQLFLQRAQSYLVHDDGSKPQDDELKAAAVIVEQVLPAYAEALKPAAPVTRAGGKTVDITLVRWPYT